MVGIGLLLISGRLHASDLLPLAMLLSNTYGKVSVIDVALRHSACANGEPALESRLRHWKLLASASPLASRRQGQRLAFAGGMCACPAHSLQIGVMNGTG